MKRLHLKLKRAMTYYSSIVCKPQREKPRRLVPSVKPMCTFDKVLNQWVDWVAWAIIQIYGARGAIDDACTTTSGSMHNLESHDCHMLPLQV